MNGLKNLQKTIAISRPRFYLYLFGPWLLGSVAATSQLNLLQNWQWLLWSFFWIVPANIILYGINDVADRDTDRFNTAKKGQEEHLFQTSDTNWLVFWILSSACLLTYLATLLPLLPLLLTVAWLVLALLYSLPPIRLKTKPLLDSYSNVLYVLPGFASFTWLSDSLPIWWIPVAAWSWAIALHSFSAIPDIMADHKAGIATIATWLGLKGGLLFATFHWAIASGMSIYFGGWLFAPTLLYPLLVFSIRNLDLDDIRKWYWKLPWLNALIGGYFYALLAFKLL